MIGILCFNSLRYAQFVYKYADILEQKGVQYEVVYWNREGDYLGRGSNWISYDKRVNTFQPFYRKIIDFIGFTNFLYSMIAKKRYDKLIVLTTQTAIPLYPLLTRKYKSRYIYDYRDITYENIGFYKKMVDSLIECSAFTAISSNGFIDSQYLGKHPGKFIISHNSRTHDIKHISCSEKDSIRIVYWGQVRQPEFNKKICDILGNDYRFHLVYHGAGFHEEIKRYVLEKEYTNIEVTGAYNLQDIPKFAASTDYILNMYENDKQQQPAMTVKFYDSIHYQIPMIVSRGSYMARVVQKNGLGIVFSSDETSDELFRKIRLFDKEKYVLANANMMKSVVADDQNFENRLLDFVESPKEG